MVRKGIQSPGTILIAVCGKIRGNGWECQC
jgi:hypothetical protein